MPRDPNGEEYAPYIPSSKSAPSYNIRCLHIDYERPSRDPFEFKWRCPATFAYDGVHIYCPQHRGLYIETDNLASPQQVSTVINAVHRFASAHRMPDAAEDDGSREAAAREQYQLRSRALSR